MVYNTFKYFLSNCKITLKGLGDFKREGPLILVVKLFRELVLPAKEETVLQYMID